MPDLVIIDGGKGQVERAKEVLDELGLHDIPLAGWPRSARSCSGRAIAEPVVLPRDVVGAVPRPAPPRRGPPVRDHLPPRPALEAPDALCLRRPARRRPEAATGAARVFGSAKRVREAPVEQIAAVPGIGAALAARIKQTLEA